MYKEDSLYQVLLKYNFDLFRGDKGITEYMSEHCNQFYTDVSEAVNGNNPFLSEKFTTQLEEKLDLLNYICNEIPMILDTYDQGFIKKAYEKSNELFDKVKEYFITRFSWRESSGSFCRIRQGDFRIKDKTESKKQKTELFHIKKEKRNRIGAYRYSVSGYPCLYLASNRELAWFESGMPKKFSYCQMLIDEEGENALKLIDFSNRPVDFLSNMNIWLLNARKRGEADEQNVYNILLRYIITYPLAAACSVKVKNRGSKFVEEYIFPQLFMQWIRESDNIDGVRYKSSLNTNLVQGMGAINIALPVKNFREDGLDKKLTEKILISDIGYLDINEDFNKYKKILKDIQEYKDSLHTYSIEAPYCGYYVLELMDVCDCVIKTYIALMEGNYDNSELIFNYVNILCDYTDLLYKGRFIKIEECKKEAQSFKKEVDEAVIEKQFADFKKLMGEILYRNTVFHFGFENLDNYEKI